MSIATIRDGMVSTLAEVNGLRAVDDIGALKPPCAFVGLPDEIDLLTSFGGGWTYQFPVVLFATRVSERAAVAQLEAWMAETGSGSVVAALHANPTLDGACSSLACKTATDFGETALGEGDRRVSCLTAKLSVEVFT